ncbi:hypothetical protein ID866_2698 [Astraeus odoratus]|nr:hypothetical protein ID866_2698 [Astraeus odoratus]
MAPAPTTEPEINPYELLSVSQEATEAEIRSAYRSRSLKVHPDRNRNDPDAARKFHELTNASNILLDPLRRLALDAQLRLAAAKKARFAAYDAKRQNLVTELEEREREFKRARLEKEKARAAREGENDRVKEAGRRLREEREREREEQQRANLERTKAEHEDLDVTAPPALGPYDTTIRVKFPLAKFPELSTASALAAHFKRFGEVDEDAIVLSVKPKKPGKKKKSVTQEKCAPDGQSHVDMIVNALVTFNQISAAFGVISSGPKLKEQGMEVAWAGGESEPPILQWLRDRGELGRKSSEPFSGSAAEKHTSKTPQIPTSTDSSKFYSFPSTFPSTFPVEPPPSSSIPPTTNLDYESLTLLRLREAERARLEREILEAEARDQES